MIRNGVVVLAMAAAIAVPQQRPSFRASTTRVAADVNVRSGNVPVPGLTAGDFVLGRYGNRGLELAVALTGILATMPYIALQLVGMEKVIAALGVSGQGWMQHAPITIAFS